MTKNKKLLLFVSEDWYFLSHRLELAIAARNRGYDVHVLTQVNDDRDRILELGFKLSTIKINRHGRNLIRDLGLLLAVIRVYRKIRPGIVHHVAIKPVLYGTLAAAIARIPLIVNTFAGLGALSKTGHRSGRLLANLVYLLFRMTFGATRTEIIVQNMSDAAVLLEKNVVKQENLHLIKGSGVDTNQFIPRRRLPGLPVILFAGRLLWSKGMTTFVRAAEITSNAGVKARFVIVGRPDRGNPDSVPENRLRDWCRADYLEWWGYRKDMPEVVAGAGMVCLPSNYGEGIPRILIEAAACGVPAVTTDISGCRDIVIDGETGIIVPPDDSLALSAAMQKLLANHALCRRMGDRGFNFEVQRLTKS